MKDLKTKDAMLLSKAILEMGQTAIDDLDTALDLVKINDKISKAAKINEEALSKLVVFTDKEKEFDAKNKELQKKLNDTNKHEIEEEMKKLLSENKEIVESIKEKNLKLQKASEELGNKLFKVDLPLIDKNKLPKGLKLWQYAALQPILK